MTSSDNDSEAPPPNGLSMPWLDGGRGKGGGRGGRGRGGTSSVAGEDAAAVSMEVTRGPLLASEITKLLRTQDDDASEIAGSTAASLRGGKRKRRRKDKKRASEDSESDSDGDCDEDAPPKSGCTKLVAATAFGGGGDDGSAISSSDDDDEQKRSKDTEKTFKCVGCLADRKYVVLVDTFIANNACSMEASALFQSASKLWQAKVVERASVDGVRVQRWPWKQLREHYVLHKVDQNLSRVANITAMTKARALLESQLVVKPDDGGDAQLDVKRVELFLKLITQISKETSLLGGASASSMPPPLTKK